MADDAPPRLVALIAVALLEHALQDFGGNVNVNRRHLTLGFHVVLRKLSTRLGVAAVIRCSSKFFENG